MSSLLVTCQLVAAALIEDIALNAKGRQTLGGANWGEPSAEEDALISVFHLQYSSFQPSRSSMHVPHAVLGCLFERKSGNFALEEEM